MVSLPKLKSIKEQISKANRIDFVSVEAMPKRSCSLKNNAAYLSFSVATLTILFYSNYRAVSFTGVNVSNTRANTSFDISQAGKPGLYAKLIFFCLSLNTFALFLQLEKE